MKRLLLAAKRFHCSVIQNNTARMETDAWYDQLKEKFEEEGLSDGLELVFR